MAGTPEVLYENDQWRVDADGMETTDQSYWLDSDNITRMGLAARRGYYNLPFHMREKSWCDYNEFCAAYREAARHHGCDMALVEQSIARAVDIEHKDFPMVLRGHE